MLTKNEECAVQDKHTCSLIKIFVVRFLAIYRYSNIHVFSITKNPQLASVCRYAGWFECNLSAQPGQDFSGLGSNQSCYEKTDLRGSDQVRHKPDCAATEDS